MGVCRRIVKEFQPSELTITVTIWSEPRCPPKFQQWEIKRAGCPPRIVPCTNTSSGSQKPRRRKKKMSPVASEAPTSSESESQTMIADNVTDNEPHVEIPRHVSLTSLDSVAGLGGMDSESAKTSEAADVIISSDDVTTNASDKDSESPPEDVRTQKLLKKSSFDLLSNADVALVIPGTPKKVLRKKKKSKTPESPPRYREFTETSIHMYIEMDKQNVGEFVWDQQCTRIDALVAPILELDRTTTPEIPQEIHVFD